MEASNLIVQSRLDLLEDARILDYLILDCHKKLGNMVFTQLLTLSNEQKVFKKQILNIGDEQTLLLSIEKKHMLYGTLRELIGVVGSMVVSKHWQSPEVGSFNGKIKASINDYTRDQHILGNAFEETYRKQLIPLRRTIPVFAYAVSSGMAAMTTAALFILGETKKDSTVLLGKSCYFETKYLVHKIFGERVREVDASNEKDLKENIRLHMPSAIFVDILGNEPMMTSININELIKIVNKESTVHVHMIVDISTRVTIELLFNGFVMPKNISIIGVESLNKVLQFGLDRVTAGVVWSTGFKAMKLYDYRDHAGTNCPDSAIATLPTPNRKMVSLYMKRIVRNNFIIGKSIHAKCEGGPYSILTVKGSGRRQYSRYISRVIGLARRNSIPLVRGTSFGLATTRVYAVAMHTLYEKPFLRISAGTETVWEIERLKKILVYS